MFARLNEIFLATFTDTGEMITGKTKLGPKKFYQTVGNWLPLFTALKFDYNNGIITFKHKYLKIITNNLAYREQDFDIFTFKELSTAIKKVYGELYVGFDIHNETITFEMVNIYHKILPSQYFISEYNRSYSCRFDRLDEVYNWIAQPFPPDQVEETGCILIKMMQYLQTLHVTFVNLNRNKFKFGILESLPIPQEFVHCLDSHKEAVTGPIGPAGSMGVTGVTGFSNRLYHNETIVYEYYIEDIIKMYKHLKSSRTLEYKNTVHLYLNDLLLVDISPIVWTYMTFE